MRSNGTLSKLGVFAIPLFVAGLFSPSTASSIAEQSSLLEGPDGQVASVAKPAISGSIFYVTSDGDDTNDGTEDSPWGTIQHAADQVQAGDLVVVAAGEYPERVFVSTSGTAGAPITFKADGAVKMRGFTIGADYIAVRGFDIADTGSDWVTGWGILVEGKYCVIEDNYIYYAARGGILLNGLGEKRLITTNCVVRNNRLERNHGLGIEIQGRDHLIEGNEVWATIQHHPDYSPTWADADGMHFHGSGHRIVRNYIHDIRYADPENVDPHIDCFQTFESSDKEAASNILFEGNICIALESQGIRESGYGFMLQDAMDITIRNNIIQAFGGINTGAGGNQNLFIVNNLFANDLELPLTHSPVGVSLQNCPNSAVMNNIFYEQKAYGLFIEGSSFTGLEAGWNLHYRSDGESPWGEPYPGDLWQVDPLFVNPTSRDFHLQSGSPAIDAGETISNLTTDFEGSLRPQGDGYDIGPYEHTAGQQVPTQPEGLSIEEENSVSEPSAEGSEAPSGLELADEGSLVAGDEEGDAADESSADIGSESVVPQNDPIGDGRAAGGRRRGDGVERGGEIGDPEAPSGGPNLLSKSYWRRQIWLAERWLDLFGRSAVELARQVGNELDSYFVRIEFEQWIKDMWSSITDGTAQ